MKTNTWDLIWFKLIYLRFDLIWFDSQSQVDFSINPLQIKNCGKKTYLTCRGFSDAANNSLYSLDPNFQFHHKFLSVCLKVIVFLIPTGCDSLLYSLLFVWMLSVYVWVCFFLLELSHFLKNVFVVVSSKYHNVCLAWYPERTETQNKELKTCV